MGVDFIGLDEEMIPRILHQIWVGPSRPSEVDAMLSTWRAKHPTWDYELWTNEHDPVFDELRAQIDSIPEWCGKADCMRYILLEKFGGVYADADSVCLRPIDELCKRELVAFEHELIRPNLLANGTLGLIPGSDVARYCIDAIKNVRSFGERPTGYVTGPWLLTEAWAGGPGILPARSFYPVHWTGAPAPGDATIYAMQRWGSTTKLYPDAPDAQDNNLARSCRRNIALVERALGLNERIDA